MAKALLGYVGGPDPRLVTEVRRLQRRVIDLEADPMDADIEFMGLTEAGVDQFISVTLDAKQGPDVNTLTFRQLLRPNQ